MAMALGTVPPLPHRLSRHPAAAPFVFTNQACLAAAFPVAQISPSKNSVLSVELLCFSVPRPNQNQNQDIMQLNSILTFSAEL